LVWAPLVCLGAFSPQQSRGDALPPIFSGKDLTGWKVPVDNIWWTAQDDVLSVKSDPRKKASVLWTDKEYQNFVVQFEFKFGAGKVDSGIFLRHPNEQIQIGISGSLKRDMTGSPYIGSKRWYPVEAEGVAELLKLEDWNAMTIVAKDYSCRPLPPDGTAACLPSSKNAEVGQTSAPCCLHDLDEVGFTCAGINVPLRA